MQCNAWMEIELVQIYNRIKRKRRDGEREKERKNNTCIELDLSNEQKWALYGRKKVRISEIVNKFPST